MVSDLFRLARFVFEVGEVDAEAGVGLAQGGLQLAANQVNRCGLLPCVRQRREEVLDGPCGQSVNGVAVALGPREEALEVSGVVLRGTGLALASVVVLQPVHDVL
jgi:hypothetical protein